MDLAIFFGIAIVISAIAYFITFWISLWIMKWFVKNKNARYALVGVLNAFLTPIGFAVQMPGLPKIATYVLVGLPILGLMWWLDERRTASTR